MPSGRVTTMGFSLRSRSAERNRKAVNRRKTSDRRRGRTFRPGIEPLETRVLLNTDYWRDGVSGSWSDGSKWSLGEQPGINDTAVINAAGLYTVTVDIDPLV